MDPSGRYFLPFAAPLALTAGEWAWSVTRVGKVNTGRGAQAAVLGLLVVFQAWGNLQAALRYPPVTAMINVVVRGSTLERALDAARALAREVTRAVVGRPIAVLGPAPAPLMRLRGEHRAQFFLKGGDRAVMNAAIRRALAAHPALARRTSVDVDPVSML